MEKKLIPTGSVSKNLLIANAVMSLIYISWWFDLSHAYHPVLYGLLFFGEIYHVFMTLMFCYTMWPYNREHRTRQDSTQSHEPIDVFITVAGEPVEVIAQTVEAAKRMTHPKKHIYILNDGYVAKKDNWQDVEKLAKTMNIHCITRKVGGGAKAGNINNALKQTKSSFVMLLDADMKPHSDFLSKTLPYFSDKKVGFVQTPQYYENQKENEVAAGAWEQQSFFFGPVMIGKDRSNSAFICGTNVVLRRTMLEEVGGIYEKSIAEDFLTSVFVHQNGWKSVYVSEVLCEGMAPHDLLSYYKQQLRWARGSLQVLFGENPLFKHGLTFKQKLQYLSSALYYFNGLIVVIDMVMPLLFLYGGIQIVRAATTSFALFFVPFMFLNLLTLYLASGKQITYRAIAFSQASWFLQLKALFSVITGQSMGFSVTPKEEQKGNFVSLALPHLFYLALVAGGGVVGILREGLSPSVVTNIAWGIFNVALFMPFIRAAYPWKRLLPGYLFRSKKSYV